MGNLGILALTLCIIHPASSVLPVPVATALHTLKYLYTAVTPGIEFPEFTILGLLDEEPFVHYDSNFSRMIPKAEWIKQSMGADYWEGETLASLSTQQWFKASIVTAMQRFNQTQGVHTLQRMYGCEWDDESGATEEFSQYGYDGEDFLTQDMKHQRYIAPVQQAFLSALKLNDNPYALKHWKWYLNQECVDWLKKYVRYGRSSLERTVPPQVSLLQKDPSSPVTCHVTGFYPRGVMVTWQKDGQKLDEGVELGETVPNGDGTFQTRSVLRVKPEEWKRDRYTCTVLHKSLEQDIILTVTEENVRRNMDIKSIIIGCVVGSLLLLIIAAIAVFMWKKRTSGYGKTSTTGKKSDTIQKPPPEPVVSDTSKQPSVEPEDFDTGSATSSHAESTSSLDFYSVSEAGSDSSDTPLLKR